MFSFILSGSAQEFLPQESVKGSTKQTSSAWYPKRYIGTWLKQQRTLNVWETIVSAWVRDWIHLCVSHAQCMRLESSA